MDSTGIVVAVIAGVPAIASALFAFRASSQANKVGEKKVDAEAFERSQTIYDKIVDRLQSQVDQLQGQLSRTGVQLASEQDVSFTLRNQVRTLQQQVESLSRTVADLRAR